MPPSEISRCTPLAADLSLREEKYAIHGMALRTMVQEIGGAPLERVVLGGMTIYLFCGKFLEEELCHWARAEGLKTINAQICKADLDAQDFDEFAFIPEGITMVSTTQDYCMWRFILSAVVSADTGDRAMAKSLLPRMVRALGCRVAA